MAEGVGDIISTSVMFVVYLVGVSVALMHTNLMRYFPLAIGTITNIPCPHPLLLARSVNCHGLVLLVT